MSKTRNQQFVDSLVANADDLKVRRKALEVERDQFKNTLAANISILQTTLDSL